MSLPLWREGGVGGASASSHRQPGNLTPHPARWGPVHPVPNPHQEHKQGVGGLQRRRGGGSPGRGVGGPRGTLRGKERGRGGEGRGGAAGGRSEVAVRRAVGAGRAAGLRLPFLPELGAAARGRKGSGGAAEDPPAPPNGVGVEKGSWAGRAALGRASGLALEARGAGRDGGVWAAGLRSWSAGGRLGSAKVPSRKRGLRRESGAGLPGPGRASAGGVPVRGEHVRASGGGQRPEPRPPRGTSRPRGRRRARGWAGATQTAARRGDPGGHESHPPGRGGALSPGRCWRPRWGSAGGVGGSAPRRRTPRQAAGREGRKPHTPGRRRASAAALTPGVAPRECERATHSCPRRFSGGPSGPGG